MVTDGNVNKGVVRKLAREQLKQYGLRLLGSRALTEVEVRTKLTRRAEDEADVGAIIEELRGYGFLNDERFAEHFASARRDSGVAGKQRVLRDLRVRRVAGPVAEEAVKAAYEDADEVAMVRAWLERKMRNVDLAEYLSEEKHLASVYRKLRYAGFASNAILPVLRKFSSRANDLEDSDEGEP
ncbi:MAG: RecX family transcriptional regulator [Bryobacteraceae bacterium]|nr:RecX family transcriptional regulator [Bryobacteraceae bacterium]